MPIALVLMNIVDVNGGGFLESLKSIEEVKGAYAVFGVYDIVVKIEADERDRIEDIIVWKIRKLNGVRQTTTMWVYAGFDKN